MFCFNESMRLSLCILSDGSGTELLIVLVRHYAQRFHCVNSFQITCSALLTDPHGRVSQHIKACLNFLTLVTSCCGNYMEETDSLIAYMQCVCVCPHWCELGMIEHGPHSFGEKNCSVLWAVCLSAISYIIA